MEFADRQALVAAELNVFVGRESLLADGARLIQAARLVTLYGVGGVGKTRIATRLAADVGRAFESGVCLVDLTAVTEADALAGQLTAALGILDNSREPGEARLIQHLRDKEILLVLDNCEHLLRPVQELLRVLLLTSEKLRVLVTSRVKLRIEGERPLEVPPLTTDEAMALLSDRGRAVNGEWERALSETGALPPQDAHAACTVCELLEGIPLSIELAAGRLDATTIQEIVEHITRQGRPAAAWSSNGARASSGGHSRLAAGDRLSLLVDGPEFEQRHHHSLQATMDWSFGLLPQDERRLWALSWVFVRGFDLSAAEAVCTRFGLEQSKILRLLANLVRHSVLTTETHHGRTRYRMLESLREYGVQHLSDDDLSELEQAHADYFAGLLQRAADTWYGPDETVWMACLDSESPNFRAAMDFLLGDPGQAPRALELAINAVRSRFQIFNGKINEARRWLNYALDEQPEAHTELEVAGLSLLAYLSLIQGDIDDARPALRRAESVARALGIAEESGSLILAQAAERWLANSARSVARSAVAMFGRAEELFLAAGCRGDANMALMFQSMAAGFVGDRTAALGPCARLLAEAEARGARWAVSWALWDSALVELVHGDAVDAARLVQRSLRMQREMGDTWGPAWGLWLAAVIAAVLDNHDLAAQLFGGADERQRITKVTVYQLLPYLQLEQRYKLAGERELGAVEYDVKVSVGRALRYDQVFDLALGPLAPDREQARKFVPPGGLTPREFDVAAHVAKGMTSRQIAAELGISYRTVETHLQNIMPKLGFSNRIEVAAWHAGLPSAGQDSES
ncbi:AAA family ATPase [Amycolatopsis acidicola]|uniref:AAA family ATPase n=1 Tax=Amycolatopsis acidicola TaxID=2596893 RepID=A0A5N0VC77_9PSEU|nr:LuxR C-terminal-related transcriptional regulator [Amycolatopsis acidicola]KAA9163979.1 AAA family ATPase [Amycolatopsis acidicola]